MLTYEKDGSNGCPVPDALGGDGRGSERGEPRHRVFGAPHLQT